MAIRQVLLTFLFNACWQIILIAAAAAIGDRLIRGSSPRYRHNLWVAALLLAFITPAITTGSAQFAEGFYGTSSVAVVQSEPLRLDGATPDVLGSQMGTYPLVLTLGTNLAITLIVGYFLFILYRGLRLFKAWRRTRVIAKSGYTLSQLPAPIQSATEKCFSNISIRNVTILFSATATGPGTIGNSNPLIILPEALLEETDENVLVSAIGHELAHINRRDYILNLIYELMIIPLAFHPVVTLLKRRINETRELCCDSDVSERFLQAEHYARSLVKLAGSAANLGRPALTTTVGMGDADNLEVRIMTLLRGSKVATGRRNPLIVAGLLLFMTVGLVVGGLSLGAGVVEQVIAQDTAKQKPTEVVAQVEESEAEKQKVEVRAKLESVRNKIDETRAILEYKTKLATQYPTWSAEQERIKNDLIALRTQLESIDGGKPDGNPEDLVPPETDVQAVIANDQSLRVTKKPRPSARGCEGTGTEGKAIAKVTFLSNGTIGEVSLVEESTCSSFNESVLRIAKEIEFEPAVKDGQPITVTKHLEYQWAIY